MKPKTMYRIALVLGSQAAGLPATLFGIPVIASNSSPAQITLLDPSAILYSDSGRLISISVSNLYSSTPRHGPVHGRDGVSELVSAQPRHGAGAALAGVAESVAYDDGQFHDRELLTMRQPARIQAGLQEIADWHAWFVGAHTQRLADLHLPQAE